MSTWVSLDQPADTDEATSAPRDIKDWRDNSEESYARTGLRAILSNALENLETPLRVVFALRDIEGVSPEETATVLGLSVAAVKTRLMRARLNLRKRLSAWFENRSVLATSLSLEELWLHQQITEAVVVASLDVDYVVDQIDNEGAQIVELQSIVLAQRQRAIGTTNLVALALSTGLGAVSGVLQFSDTTKSIGNGVGFAAGGLLGLLSFHSLRQQHSGVRKAWVLPSMPAPFFSGPPEQSVYPADIWA